MYTTFQKPITGSIQVFIFLLSVFISVNANAATKTAATSGTWATGGNWSPSGAPAAGDSVIIPNGKTMNIGANTSVASIYVATGGAITFSGNKSLTMTQSLTVNGTFTMNNTNISFASGKSFTLGAGSSFTWDPQTNNAANATLFTNGVENFSATSSLIINEWYDYTLPIGSVVTGNFGNLRLNSLNGGSIYEWRQQNYFSTHVIQGTLTVDQGWIVLDKSGAISSTTIGNIVLLNANSYLDCHGGTHSGSFTVNTTNLTITDGMMTGIYNGNGNVTLNVTGTATLNGAGILSLVMNSGVANVGNGNGTLNVTGNFVQNKGGFYGIYNGTTTNAGVCNVTITGNLTYTGGDFMVHAGCHTGTSTSSLSVGGNTTITYTSATDAFWIVGLSSVGATNNSVKLNWKNNGNVTISGNAGGEFTGSAGSGAETDSILGNLSVAGGTNAFNWPGATAQSHTTTVYTGGTTTVSGGELTYSYFGGSLTGTLAGNVSVTGGTMIVKRESGAATMNLSGSFTQSAGTVYLHNNSSTYTPNAVNVTVDGNFTQSGGTINYDNNTSGSSAQHSITLNGSNYTLSGSGAITRTDAAANTIFGMLYFNRAGTTTMSRSGSSHLITQVKQTINNGATLNVSSGNLQISNHSIASTSYLRVASGGTLIMNSNRIYAAGSGTKTGMQVDASGTLKTTNTYGFYDNTSNATVDPGSSMDILLDPQSTVEYNGVDNQVVTGIGIGNATGTNQKYGILTINFQGTANSEYAYLNGASSVYVRTQLNLGSGEFNLNADSITIENGNTSAINVNTGYIKSETNAAINTSVIVWKSMSTGPHVFPFGVNSTSYIPVTFNVTAGSGTDVYASTRATTASDNVPWSGLSNVSAVNTMAGNNSSDQSVSSVIDRWWNFVAPGVTATVTLSYLGSENTISPALQNGNLAIQNWDGNQWLPPAGSGTGVTSGIGTVTVNNADFFSPWIIVSSTAPLPIELVFFKAMSAGETVKLVWSTAAEINNDYFTIERSTDGMKYTALSNQPGAGNSTQTMHYTAEDPNPARGYNYYRLKQTDYDGKYTYSNIETVKFKGSDMAAQSLSISSIGPNPFQEKFTVSFVFQLSADVELELLNQSGQVVFKDNIHTNEGMNQYDFLDQIGLEKGVYFINLKYENKKVTQKIVKS